MLISFDPKTSEEARDASAMLTFLASRWDTRSEPETVKASYAKPLSASHTFYDDSGAKAEFGSSLGGKPAPAEDGDTKAADEIRATIAEQMAEDTGVVETVYERPAEPVAEAAVKKTRKPRTHKPAEPALPTAATEALAAAPRVDVGASLGEEAADADEPEAEAIGNDMPTPDHTDDLMALMGEMPDAPAADRFAGMDSETLHVEFISQVRLKGGAWFRDQLLRLGRDSVRSVTDDDKRALLREIAAEPAPNATVV